MTYLLNKKAVTTEDFENDEVYGITVCNNDAVILKIEDISTDKKFVEYIIKKFSVYDVSLYHIVDIIEDEIFEHLG